MTLQIILADLDATRRLGANIALMALDWPDDQIWLGLNGTLGAGKTTLVQSIGKALDVVEIINSPTFTMFNEYHSGNMPLYHLDLYRGGETGEKIDLSFLSLELDELMQDGGMAVLEWPQYYVDANGRSFLQDKQPHISINLSEVRKPEESGENPAARLAVLEGHGPDSQKFVEALGKRLQDIVIKF